MPFPVILLALNRAVAETKRGLKALGFRVAEIKRGLKGLGFRVAEIKRGERDRLASQDSF